LDSASNVTEASDSQPWKALLPILTMDAGMRMLFNPLSENTLSPISRNPDPASNVIDSSEWHD
jgi:hypothetical protein